jgi:hypothetical protein
MRLKKETRIYGQKNGNRQMDMVCIDKCRCEIQERKEVPV